MVEDLDFFQPLSLLVFGGLKFDFRHMVVMLVFKAYPFSHIFSPKGRNKCIMNW
jgi:hypothetical protein